MLPSGEPLEQQLITSNSNGRQQLILSTINNTISSSNNPITQSPLKVENRYTKAWTSQQTVVMVARHLGFKSALLLLKDWNQDGTYNH